MATDRDPSTGMLGMLAGGVGLCCALPLLLGTGLAIGATGFYIGRGVLIAAGVAVGASASYRRQRFVSGVTDSGRSATHPEPTGLVANGPGQTATSDET